MKYQQYLLCLIPFVILIAYIGYTEYSTYIKNHTMMSDSIEKKEIYSNKIQQQEYVGMTNNDRIHYHIEMYQLYHDGVEDRYDLRNQKIKGIPPNPKMAIQHVEKAIDLGYTKGYLVLARLYHNGIHDLPVDLEKAKKYYQHIIDNNLDYSIDAIDNMKLIVDNEIHSDRDGVLRWLNMPRIRTNSATTTNNVIEIKPDKDPDEPEHRDIRNEITSDTQNVHDHTLIKTVLESIHNLQKSTNISIPLETTVKNLRYHIGNKSDCDKKEDALKTLDTIERNHQELMAFKMKEVDLLNLLWNRIANNHEGRDDLKDNIYNQLADSVEHDNVVCSTGRFTRLLDSLNVVDENVHIKSRALINRELMDKSAMIRQELYDSCTSDEKEDIDSPSDSQVLFDFTEQLKTRIRNDFHNDYVKTKILTQDELDTELSVWINYI